MANQTQGNLTSRVISAVLVCILSGYWIHFDYVRWHQRGRDAYLAYQSHRFDQSMASPHPALVTIVGVFMVIGAFLAIYELIAAGASRLIRSSESLNPEVPPSRDFR
jgi:hypothetical protein